MRAASKMRAGKAGTGMTDIDAATARALAQAMPSSAAPAQMASEEVRASSSAVA